MGELQKHRNANQERVSAEEREKNFVQEPRNAERKAKIEERVHMGTQRSTGMRAHLRHPPILCDLLCKVLTNKI